MLNKKYAPVMENEYLVGKFSGINEHQSFPGRMHGGMISAILDEGIGRAIWIYEPSTWGVTTHLNVKYRKPVPLYEDLILIFIITYGNKFTSSKVKWPFLFSCSFTIG